MCIVRGRVGSTGSDLHVSLSRGCPGTWAMVTWIPVTRAKLVMKQLKGKFQQQLSARYFK